MKKIIFGIFIIILLVLVFIFLPIKKNDDSPNNFNSENDQNVLQNDDLNFEDKSKISGYIIKDYEGKIAVFDINDEEKPSKITPISVKDLPEADKNLLKELLISLVLIVFIRSFFIITTLFRQLVLVFY